MILIDPTPRPGGCPGKEPPPMPFLPGKHRHTHVCIGQHHSGREHICACGEWFVVVGK